MDAQTKRPSSDELGATVLFPTLTLGNDPETKRGMLGNDAADGLWAPEVAAASRQVTNAAARL